MTDELHERIYNDIFEGMCRRLEHQKATDERFTIKELEARLNWYYIYEGNDWTGRGGAKELEDRAVIAAMEHVLAEWRAENQQ
jgi:hypothetical protein